MRILKAIAVACATLGLSVVGASVAAPAGGHANKAPEGGWTFDGYFGTYDQIQLQRGYKVYREVCSSCHGMKLVSFRNLGQKDGPFFDAAYPNPNDNPYVKAIVAEYQVDAIDPETGDAIKAPAKTSDRFPSPYANEAAARGSNGGALPPDLSVIVHARHDGADYIYSLLTGYYAPPGVSPWPAASTTTPTSRATPRPSMPVIHVISRRAGSWRWRLRCARGW
jgi:ubiquinol-cytochrome c reductase cytochrome c1 subunit